MHVRQNVRRRVMERVSSLLPGSGERRDGPETAQAGADPADDAPAAERDRDASDRPTDPAPEQLVSPRERVLTLLARNGGRMKQAEFVSAVEWSESTVSRRLCNLEAEEAVVRYRIGREKVVFLPDEVPASFRSPQDREDERKKLAA